MSEAVHLPTLLTEAEAYDLYGHVLQDKELRRARERREIGYYLRKGRVLYRADELATFVENRLERSYVAPCKTNSASGNTGFQEYEAQPNGTGSTMTPELVKSAADLLKQRILRKPKSGSPQSSSRKAKLHLVNPET